LYQTKNGKNLPWYYCKTNGKDFLEQYEFIGGKWNKVCIKKLGGKDYFDIKPLNMSDSIASITIPKYSKEILDNLLKTNNPDCELLKKLV
jgi:hypothetical protein